MNARSGRLAVLAAVLVWTLALSAAGPALAADGDACTGADGVCLGDVTLSTDRLVAGETATLDATVHNAGDDAANVTVVLNTAGPDDATDSYTLRRTSLGPGETATLSQSLDASTPGTHGLQLVVYDGSLSRQYDTSTARTLTVEARGLGGSLDRSEYALGALVGSLAVVGGIGYRRR